MQLNDLYKEIILDHYQSPHNRGRPPHAHIEAEGSNPLCGDEIEVYVLLDGDRLKELRFDGAGCAISLAAASMMSEVLEGKSKEEAGIISDLFTALMHGEDVSLPEEMEDLESLKGVANFPLRVKCALLPWTTLAHGLANENAGRRVSIEVE
ncbi:MAG: SUF system NifU family Fe-S cluster assembly protein [Chloroflexi bacterium]|nr:SUF system NifU family Fe-S cluster assembly protein [Chloroflexota bacterium]